MWEQAPTILVSLAAGFLDVTQRSPKTTLRDIQKTAASETPCNPDCFTAWPEHFDNLTIIFRVQ